MKTNRITGLILIITIFLSSCDESFFDKYPTDSITESSFYTNKVEIEYALNDAYRTLKSAYLKYFNIGDLPTDDTYNAKINNNHDNISINESNVTSTNGVVSSIWSGHYQVISRVNIVLNKMLIINLDANIADRFKGECLFLRGLMYFNLVRIFGDVPLVLADISTVKDAFSYGREPVEKVYATIEEDLLQAIDLLPEAYTDNEDAGRATSLASRALLGKVYLTTGRYKDAYDILLPVTTSGVHALLNDYFDVFDAQNPNNQEILFAIQYARGYSPSLGNNFQFSHFSTEQITKYAPYLVIGRGEYLITQSFMNAIDRKNDKRMCYIDSAYNDNTHRMQYFSTKYIDRGQTEIADSGSDVMILRYSDVLLMLAEAEAQLNHTSVALSYLEQVRTRAGLTTDATVANSKETMLTAIENERRIEFFSEAHRWFDMLRFGNLQEIMNAHFADGASFHAEETGYNPNLETQSTVEDYELLWPIPVNEVVLNSDKITQNPGY